MVTYKTTIRRNWTREELIAAFNLYCQLPFGKLHKTNPQIMQLAELLDRTASSISMKLVNFASLDPAITANERVGLQGASNLDREIWAEFNTNWEGLAVESQSVIERLAKEHDAKLPFTELDIENVNEVAETLVVGRSRSAVVQVRVKPIIFQARRAGELSRALLHERSQSSTSSGGQSYRSLESRCGQPLESTQWFVFISAA